MPYTINMSKALDAATQGLVDAVREDHGLCQMPFEDMPQSDQKTWRKRASRALNAALEFIQ